MIKPSWTINEWQQGYTVAVFVFAMANTISCWYIPVIYASWILVNWAIANLEAKSGKQDGF